MNEGVKRRKQPRGRSRHTWSFRLQLWGRRGDQTEGLWRVFGDWRRCERIEFPPLPFSIISFPKLWRIRIPIYGYFMWLVALERLNGIEFFSRAVCKHQKNFLREKTTKDLDHLQCVCIFSTEVLCSFWILLSPTLYCHVPNSHF